MHALMFEAIAVVLCTGAGMLLLDMSPAQLGVLTIAISLIAMLWNMIFNALFDRLQRRFGFVRNVAVRILHACCFEVGLAIMVVPLAAWWLDTTLIRAFWLDFGILLFFLPYTFFFNLVYDRLRARWVARRRAG